MRYDVAGWVLVAAAGATVLLLVVITAVRASTIVANRGIARR